MNAIPAAALDPPALWDNYRPTSLVEFSSLARQMNIARVFAKMENERPLGNFKVLGGMVAGLRALARVAGGLSTNDPAPPSSNARLAIPHEGLQLHHAYSPAHAQLPRLICASDGNHGLAVAAAAARVGAKATIYLPLSASPIRADRIKAVGGDVLWVDGTYDDAVEAASAAAARAEGLLIPDTSADPNDAVVKDVMAGYALLPQELRDQLPLRPTHVFVQAGVGGLAAAMAEGLHDFLSEPGRIVVVEPESAACVAQALAAGRPIRIPGSLETSAEMLSCGVASALALEILTRYNVGSVLVSEQQLRAAVAVLREAGGSQTTPSGAAGLAGLLHATACAQLRKVHHLGADSNVLFVVTEGAALNSSD